MSKIDIVVAPIVYGLCSVVMYKLIKDIVQMRENRPAVTDAMVEQAYRCQVMSDFDSEFDEIDWEN